MNTLFYNLTGKLPSEGTDALVEEEVKVSKGITEVTFSLKNIVIYGYGVVNIEIDFNDGSPKYIRDCDYDNPNFNILQEDVIHRYIPDHLYDNTLFYPVITVKYLDMYNVFRKLTIIIPIRISRPSFYGEHRCLSVNNIQFIDEVGDPIFTTLQTANGDILNLKIK